MGDRQCGVRLAAEAARFQFPVARLLGVETAQVVEGDSGAGKVLQPSSGAAEQAVARAAVGDGAQVVGDVPGGAGQPGTRRLHGVPVLGAGVQQHRMQHGEPPDGPRDVQVRRLAIFVRPVLSGQFAQVDVPPVALDVHEHRPARGVARPPVQRHGQGGQQHVAGRRAEGVRDLGEQGRGVVGAEHRAERFGGGDGVPRRVERAAADRTAGAGGQGPPPLRLRLEARGLGCRSQGQGPGPQRYGYGR
nr:hypothetical protein [Streptomyces sp. WAC 06725]